MCEIQNAQNNFLARYNPNRDQQVAFDKAWGAALQHNALYAANCGPTDQRRRDLKNFVQKFINNRINIDELLLNPMTQEEYLATITELKTLANQEFGDCFRPEGYRISHAQKVLGVYMKHLWCMGQIQTPPQCPIDRNILVTISQYPQYRRFRNLTWTDINDLNVHCEIIAAIQAIAPAQQIADWELLNFQG
jgi:hypothetical protein